MAEDSVMEDGTGTGTAAVPEVWAGLAVLSPEAGVSLAGVVSAGVVASVGVVVTPPYEDGLADEAPGETGAGEVAGGSNELSTSVGLEDASGESEGAAVGDEGSFTFVNP